MTQMFLLQRDQDVSGVTGTGVVAEGIQFADGRVALRWCVGDHRSTSTWDSMDAVRAIYGHDDRTKVVWLMATGYNHVTDEVFA